MHFEGSKMRTGLGTGIVLTSPKGDKLRYTLQIHFAAKKLKPYFQEHPITIVCTAPLAEIIGSRDASG